MCVCVCSTQFIRLLGHGGSTDAEASLGALFFVIVSSCPFEYFPAITQRVPWCNYCPFRESHPIKDSPLEVQRPPWDYYCE